MEYRKQKIVIKLVACILVVALMAPIGVGAVGPEPVTPRASDYLMGYTAYICAMGGGNLEIWYEVTGTDFQDYLGVMSILLYESTDKQNWTWVKASYMKTTGKCC
jgi:hypothetical protein